MDNALEAPIAEAPSKKRFLAAVLVVIILGGLGFYLSRPLFASYYLKKGIAEFQSSEAGNLERADSYFQKSLRWNSNDPLTHYYLARVAFGQGTPMVGYTAWTEADWPRVIEHYEKALALGLEKKDALRAEIALSDTGRAYRKLENYEKADEIFREHISRYPDKSFVDRYLLALDDFEVNNNPEEGLAVLPAAIEAKDKIDLRMFRVYTLLARYKHFFGDFDAAERYAKMAIESVPVGEEKHLDIQIAHIILGYQLARDKNIKAALAEFDKVKAAATELPNPSNAFRCSLAGIYLQNNDYKNAIETAEKKLKNRLDKSTVGYADSICLQVLGDSFLAQGKKKEAKKYLEQYLDITGAFKDKNIYVMRNRAEFQKILNDLVIR